jgi:hypothetical protein
MEPVKDLIVPILISISAGILTLVIVKRWVTSPRWWPITAALGLVAAGAFAYYFYPRPKPDQIVAGHVIDASTEKAIEGAHITVDGRTEEAVSDSYGNFQLKLVLPLPEHVSLRTEKRGYSASVATIAPGTHNVPIPLRALK